MMPARETELKKMLEEHRRTLRVQLRRKIRALRETAWLAAGRPSTDLADDPAHEDVDFAVVQLQTDTMREIDRALDRLSCSEYGVCEECRQEIPVTRLSVVPFATRCRACQERAERDSPRKNPEADAAFARL